VIMCLSPVFLMPGVNSGLDSLPLFQELNIFWPKRGNNPLEGFPEGIRVDIGPRCDFLGDKIIKDFGDLQAASLDTVSHVGCPHRVAKKKPNAAMRRY